MGIITKLVITGATAGIGFGIGYFMHSSNQAATYVDCRSAYEQGLKTLQDSAKDIKTTDGLATPTDFRLDYIVSKDQNFNGLVFTDVHSSKRGVITKHTTLGKSEFGFMYVDLADELKAAEAYSIQPKLLASLESKEGSKAKSEATPKESIPTILEQTIRQILEN